LTVNGNTKVTGDITTNILHANALDIESFSVGFNTFNTEGIEVDKITFFGIDNTFGTRGAYATLQVKPYGGDLEFESVRPISFNGNIKMDNGKLYINANPDSINATIKDKFSTFIAGGILSEDYAISPQSSWADHVFSTDYQLQNLNEVENFINTNKHLPGIPSATEIQENGYILHDMNVKLLQKVEELTLYSIEQNKKIEQLEGVVKSYQSLLEKVKQLESKINP
jgi:hypothetical protein